MDKFEELQEMWKGSPEPVPPPKEAMAFSSQSRDDRSKLLRQQLTGAITLLVTGAFIGWMALYGDFGFKRLLTYLGMALAILVCWLQSALLFYTWNKLRNIDTTAPPAQHLQQWEAYYDFRKRQAAWNVPLYFVALNLALGLYFIEIFSGRPAFNVGLFITVYLAWMLFAYFVLGRRSLKKENERLEGILSNLREIIAQLK